MGSKDIRLFLAEFVLVKGLRSYFPRTQIKGRSIERTDIGRKMKRKASILLAIVGNLSGYVRIRKKTNKLVGPANTLPTALYIWVQFVA